MAASIFNGTAVKILKDILRSKTKGQILFSNVDPSVTSTDANTGDLLISTTGALYIKKDNGSSVNWDVVIDEALLATQLSGYIPTTEKAAALGVATLDAGGKVPAAQLPSSVMDYKGNWNASTNTPTLVDGTGSAGDVYVTSVAGTQNLGSGNITFAAGDWIVYNGTIWEKSVNSNSVASVNGFTGAVVLDTDDIAEGTAIYFTDERAQDAVGAMATNSAKVSLTYVDGTPSLTADIVSNSLVNADINASAAIVYSKLNLSNSIVNADVAAGAAVVYSKLDLSNSIVNADIAAAAAIAYSKLNLSTSIVNADVNASAAIAYSKLNLSNSLITADYTDDSVDNTKLSNMAQSTIKGRAVSAGTGDPTDLTAAQATAILDTFVGDTGAGGTKGLVTTPTIGDATKFLRGDASWQTVSSGITELTGDVTAGPGSGSQASTIANDAVTFAKIQNITTDRLLGRDTAASGDTEELTVSGGLEFTGSLGIQRSALTGDVTATAGSNTTSIASDAVTNTQLANMATQTIKGRTTAGTGDPEDLTATQATAILNTFVGDTGSGGTKGLVPAPAAGDAVAQKFLQADGTFKSVDDLNAIGFSDRNADISVGNWAAYADAAAAVPVDMTGGSPNTTITRTTTAGEILRGAGSFKLTKSSGASRQGEGVSVSFTVPPSMQGKSCIVKFPYKITSGSAVEGDFKVFLYDITNNVIIAPFSNDIVGSSGSLIAQFNSTPSATTPADQTYRVGIHIASTTNSSINISFDDIGVESGVPAYGPSISGWIDGGAVNITATTTNPTKGASPTVDKMWYRLNGGNLDCRLEFRQANSGSSGSGDYLFALPGSYLMDTTKLTVYSTVEGDGNWTTNSTVGSGAIVVSATQGMISVVPYSSTHVRLFAVYTDGGTPSRGVVSSAAFGLANSSSTYTATFSVPILGRDANSPVTASQQLKISNIIATGVRVTVTPSVLGEYRTYQKTSSSFAGTDNAPSVGPSVADGMRIYAQNYASAGTSGQTNRWEIFVGINKVPKLFAFANAGRTGQIDVGNDFGTNAYGLCTAYDPTTGVFTVDTMTQFTSTTSRFVGTTLPAAGAAYGQPSDCYFDVEVSEKVNTVEIGGAPDYSVVPNKTTTYTATITEYVRVSASSAWTLTLPTAVGQSGKTITVDRTDNAPSNIITINTTSSQTINGALTVNSITQNELWEFVSDGANWRVKEHKTATPWTSFTPTIGATTTAPTLGTGTTVTSRWRREGTNLLLVYRIFIPLNSTGSLPGSGVYLFPLPTGITADAFINTDTSTSNMNGQTVGFLTNDQSGTVTSSGTVGMYNTSNMKLYSQTSGFIRSASFGFDVYGATTFQYSFTATIPASNWNE